MPIVQYVTSDASWRRLGEILVEKGFLDRYELECALAQQRLTGQLLGELLVAHGLVSVVDLVAALAVQRSEGGAAGDADALGPPRAAERPASVGSKPRARPLLGRLLVERGLITESGLQRALLEQRRTGGLLGEILVARKYISHEELEDALEAQQGSEGAARVAAGGTADPRSEEGTGGAPVYELRQIEGVGATLLHTAESFLDAAEAAFGVLEERDPEALEIVKVADGARETVWSYARERAEGGSRVAGDPGAAVSDREPTGRPPPRRRRRQSNA